MVPRTSSKRYNVCHIMFDVTCFRFLRYWNSTFLEKMQLICGSRYMVYYWIQSSQSTQPLNRDTTEAPSRSETLDFRHEFLGESSYKNFQMSNAFGSTITLGVKKLVRIWLDVHAVKQRSLRSKRLHVHTCLHTAIPCLHRVWTIRLTSLPPLLLLTIVNGKTL